MGHVIYTQGTYIPRRGIAGSYDHSCLPFEKLLHCFGKELYHFKLQSALNLASEPPEQCGIEVVRDDILLLFLIFRGRRNMSGQVASTLGPTGQDSSQLDEPMVDQQPSVEQPQQEEPPAEIQDITPGKEEVNGEDPVNHDEEKEKDAPGDSDLEPHLQELTVAKPGGQGGDGPDVEEEIASNTEPVEMPEAGEGQPFA
ncbi:X antigen family member 3-like isoform X2 [Muntiacus reevesi]|uniref:X antigen family member 3-like isoform X2 n=1 Tax=Muntiacus reevesi TaxID=9886 RepID=UPI0033075539